MNSTYGIQSRPLVFSYFSSHTNTQTHTLGLAKNCNPESEADPLANLQSSQHESSVYRRLKTMTHTDSHTHTHDSHTHTPLTHSHHSPLTQWKTVLIGLQGFTDFPKYTCTGERERGEGGRQR